LNLIYIMGPSGAGKDSLLNSLHQEMASLGQALPLIMAQRTITRSHHQSNENHEAIDEASFESLLQSNAFALNWFANGLHYGIRHEQLAPMSKGSWIMVNGSRAYLEQAKLRFPGLTVLHITAPVDVLRSRLLARGRENEKDIEARLSRSQSLESNPQDLYVINDGRLEDSLTKLKDLLQQRTGIAFNSNSNQ